MVKKMETIVRVLGSKDILWSGRHRCRKGADSESGLGMRVSGIGFRD